MFILRAVFWFSVVVLMIPGDPSHGGQAPRVDAMNAIAAIADLSGLCQRQPDLCESSGTAALAVLGATARHGAQWIYSTIDASLVAATPLLPGASPGGTLTPADIEPNWHAPAPHERNA